MNEIERCGDIFSKDLLLNAREYLVNAVEYSIPMIRPGMNCLDIESMLHENLKTETFWHPTKIRIGTDTLKTFREKSDPQIKVQMEDIVTIDLGPVINDYEADFGLTVGRGERFEILAHKAANIFSFAKEFWNNENCTGRELYEYCSSLAKNQNVRLLTRMNGHRISDFPHAAYSRVKLENLHQTPSPYLWVLEILIHDSSLGCCAFYEDILF